MLRTVHNKILTAARVQTCRLLSTFTPDGDNTAAGRIANFDSDDRPREMGLNRVTLIGRVGRNPEFRGSGEQTCYVFPLATNSTFWKNSTNEKITRTDWHRIAVFKPSMKKSIASADWLNKGDRLYVEGSIAYNRYRNEDGNTTSVTSINADRIVFLAKARGPPVTVTEESDGDI